MRFSRERTWERWIPALLFIVVGLFYLPVVRYGFVWDDHALLERDPRVTSGAGLASFLGPYFSGMESGDAELVHYSRPLVTLSFRLQAALHGLYPPAFHLGNVALHALCVLLLYFLLKALVRDPIAAALGAGLFAIFPTQAEPVAWVSGRTDLMACVFGLAAWLCFRRAKGLDFYSVLSGVFLLSSIGSKEVGWVFLPLFLVHDFLLKRDIRSSKAPAESMTTPAESMTTPAESMTTSAEAVTTNITSMTNVTDSPKDSTTPVAPRRSRWLPIIVAAVLGVTIRWFSLAGGPGSGLLAGSSGAGLLAGLPWWALPLRVVTSAGYYLEMLFWPWNPSALPAMRALPPPSSPIVWMGLVVCVILPWLIFRLIRGHRHVSALGLCWIAFGLFPVVNIVPLSAPSPVAERFWYMPLGGVAILLSQLFAARGARRWARALFVAGQGSRRWARALFIGLLAAWGFVTFFRLPDWRTDRTLWESEIARHGLRHPLAARNLGLARLKDGDSGGAEKVWRDALRMGLGGGTSHYYDIGISLCDLLATSRRAGEAASLASQLLTQHPPKEKRVQLESFLHR